jgi:hypothetical protein
MEQEIPIFAEAFFQICTHQIHQSLYFYYYDPSKVYFQLQNTGAGEGELENIRLNLQTFIDEDDLHVNKEKVRMLIHSVSLDFQQKNPLFPYLIFQISSDKFQLSLNDLNEIVLYAKPEKIPYSAISCWQTNQFRFRSVESRSCNTINQDKTQIMFYLAKGEIIGGTERLVIQKA